MLTFVLQAPRTAAVRDGRGNVGEVVMRRRLLLVLVKDVFDFFLHVTIPLVFPFLFSLSLLQRSMVLLLLLQLIVYTYLIQSFLTPS
jgi:hypothetical protein